MRRYLAALTLSVPITCMAFDPMPLPNCSSGSDTGSVKCKVEYTMIAAYNSEHGKFPEALSTCAGTIDEILDRRPVTGPKHDGRVSMCAQAALHLGILQPIY